ncbi:MULTISPECIES: phosphate ABC transporter permease subunit PstC [Micromonospora]|uniref:Phosphate transport system permease protein n=1 Tax=Micromonospora yangpuensis TaxID=683228 RepID=A0A1C6VCL4_9ACTN|nr:phosphate ABC transporter permease subunit PstC [Micromonospora yangpuensis]GGM13316.1 phosphate transport system permease protein [Micromonospora yangpuensis]SCL64141.1 phosphate ABC transporter membrane protein 1, PhoT family [Micromonospora yangpuensis]
MTLTERKPETRPSLAPQRGGLLADRAFSWWTLGTGLLVLAILALILITTVREAWPAFAEMGLRYVTESTWDPNPAEGAAVFGALSFMYGTAVTSLIALIIAVPVSIGIALFITELAPRRLRTTAVTVIDLLAAVPSVVFGLWGVLVLAPVLVDFYRGTHDLLGGIPVLGSVFGEAASGRNFMTAGLILAIMVTPIITSICREVFGTVPQADKDAALALGATRWEMIRGAVFPHSFGGITGAVMLGLGRAMGETIAVALVVGGATNISANVFEPGNTMAAVIVQQFGESTGTFTAALIGLGVVLFAMTVLINLVAQRIVRRAEAKMRGGVA